MTFGDIFSLKCPVCGATIGDLDLHQEFHNALQELTRHVYHPEMTAGEWAAEVERAQASAEAIRQAERAVRHEHARQAMEELRARKEKRSDG